jgi:hypothetical protein
VPLPGRSTKTLNLKLALMKANKGRTQKISCWISNKKTQSAISKEEQTFLNTLLACDRS